LQETSFPTRLGSRPPIARPGEAAALRPGPEAIVRAPARQKNGNEGNRFAERYPRFRALGRKSLEIIGERNRMISPDRWFQSVALFLAKASGLEKNLEFSTTEILLQNSGFVKTLFAAAAPRQRASLAI
jgi:hypothetical protein